MALRNRHLDLCQRLKDAGGTPYIVGGYVRDLVMGRVPNDVDIVLVNGDNQSVSNFLHCEGEQVGKDFPVFIVDGVEIAHARTERKTGRGYTGFECETQGVTLREDLERRDLRVNAMAMDPFTNEIIDPFHGRQDIIDGMLMPVGRHFGEDPLRVVRAARFAAQLEMTVGGAVADEAIGVLHELHTLPGERVFAELVKALRAPQPSRFFRALDKLGALKILFPEIEALKGRIQPEAYHPEGDAYVHTLEVIDRARELDADDEAMFAALVHDLGKAVTPDDNLPHHYNHEALGVPLVDVMCERLRAPVSFKRTGRLAAKDHLNIHRFAELKAVKKVRLIARLGGLHNDFMLQRVALASQADAQGRGPVLSKEPYPQRQAILEAARVIRGTSGHTFAHLKDGRVIAQKIEQARAGALKAAGF